MLDNSFFYFFTLSLFKNRKRYTAILFIATVVLFLLSSVLFISSSIKTSLNTQLKMEPDFVLQNRVGSRVVPMDENVVEKVLDIYGVDKVTKRVYGRYFFDKEHSVLIFGVDFLDEQSNKALENLLSKEDLKRFLSSDTMLVGEGVFRYLNSHFYPKAYNFLTPQGKLKRVEILKRLSKSSTLYSSNIAIMPQSLAKEILGLKENQINDIALNVPNESEQNTVKSKLEGLFFTATLFTKKELQEAYENLYNYKGGLFLSLYLIVIVTLALILYLRYSLASSVEKREVAILRSLGWSIRDVIKLKFFENISIVFISFTLGTVAGYIYVFMLKAPLLEEIFLGRGLNVRVELLPQVDYLSLFTILILYATTFLSSVLIPVWRVAVTEPKEALN